jgi:hypothetical protein
MSSRFDFLLLRGAFAAVLGLCVTVGAVSQAIGFRGEVVLHEGRVTIVPAPEPALQCALDAETGARMDGRTPRRRS